MSTDIQTSNKIAGCLRNASESLVSGETNLGWPGLGDKRETLLSDSVQARSVTGRARVKGCTPESVVERKVADGRNTQLRIAKSRGQAKGEGKVV